MSLSVVLSDGRQGYSMSLSVVLSDGRQGYSMSCVCVCLKTQFSVAEHLYVGFANRNKRFLSLKSDTNM